MSKKDYSVSLIIILLTEILSFIILTDTISIEKFYVLFLLNIIQFGSIICMSASLPNKIVPITINSSLVIRFIVLMFAFNKFSAEKVILFDFGCCFCGYFLGLALTINKSLKEELKPHIVKLGKALSKKELRNYNLKEKNIINELTDVYKNIFILLQNPTSEIITNFITEPVLEKLISEQKNLCEKNISESRIVKIQDSEEKIEIALDTVETAYPIYGENKIGNSIKSSKRIIFIHNKKTQNPYTKWIIDDIKNL